MELFSNILTENELPVSMPCIWNAVSVVELPNISI